jgi:integrase
MIEIKRFWKEVRKLGRHHGNNGNGANRGDILSVDPIRNLKDVRRIIRNLKDRPRDQLLFIMGVNNGVRTKDLLKLKVGQVRGVRMNGMVQIRESKTGKVNVITLNKPVYQALRRYLNSRNLDAENYLFSKYSDPDKPISPYFAGRLIQKWCSDIGLKGRFGSHTLRKTWGWMQWKHFGTHPALIQERYNHANLRQTMVYLSIRNEDINDLIVTNAIC